MKHTPLTTDLFHDLIDPCLSAIDICTRHDLTIHQLTDIIESSEYRTAVEQLAHIEQTRIESTAPLLQRIALQVLQTIAQQEPTTPTHTETIRKAAAHLARTTKPEPEPTPTQTDNQPDTQPDKQPHKEPRKQPETQSDTPQPAPGRNTHPQTNHQNPTHQAPHNPPPDHKPPHQPRRKAG